MILDKAIGLSGIACNIAGAIFVDRGTVQGAQIPGYMDSAIISEIVSLNQRRERLRKLGWRLMLVGFAASGIGIILG